MKMKTQLLLVGFLGFVLSSTANAVPILYDFNFATSVGNVTGSFTADFDDGQNAPVSSFVFNFGGVTFDIGAIVGRIPTAGGGTDFTGVSSGMSLGGGGPLLSSTVAGASLFLDTCGGIACIAEWTGIPGLSDGEEFNFSEGAVTRARVPGVSVPEPSTLGLLFLGLAGLAFARRRS